ncbi:MAG: 50S ribosomal protein L17 [Petrimonas sp.]|nr:50S ribosomal protein L17 [Proteiniphilum sp.]MEA4918948.1 50S ribosomal protein L17 [Proteiniphilum sp.]MEA4949920.1 50S ribosomal protein L17 [Petrimonas sp.]
MRHNKKNNHLGRKTAHRSAMLSNMASSLILHKRIFTTVPKAKELRKYVEPLITKSKEDTTHSRREVFSLLQSKTAVTELFQTVSQKVADRPGGYTRIIKTGFRLGDNAAMCFIELVDFNENMLGEGKAKKAKTRRSRRKASGDAVAVAATDAPKAKKAKEVKSVEETEVPATETVEAEVAEPVAEVSADEVVAEQPQAEEAPAGEAEEKTEEGQ